MSQRASKPQAGFLERFGSLLARAQANHLSSADEIWPAVRVDLELIAAGPRADLLERLDSCLDVMESIPASLLLLGLAAYFLEQGDPMQAQCFLAEARVYVPTEQAALRQMQAALYLEAGGPAEALKSLRMEDLDSDVFDASTRDRLKSLMQKSGPLRDSTEHGHALLLEYLADRPPVGLGRPRVLVEVGTTREDVPGQGSTAKLARFCAEAGIEFITVDMDPRNSQQAERMFTRYGYGFKAVTAKGEDYLATYQGPIDYVFLDAYDFDHGKHSELRQSRYERYLGGRIDEEQCHQMHLDCAHALVDKLSPDGVICFDDTWLDEYGRWTAKGTTAMPFLIKAGFRVLEARDRAALLAWCPLRSPDIIAARDARPDPA